MRVDIPDWLRQPPDQSIDHRYLSEAEIAALPPGVFFKRKSALTRTRWAKVLLVVDGANVAVELIDNRGNWRLSVDECRRVRAQIHGCLPSTTDDDEELLRALGLWPVVMPEDAPIPARSVALPRTYRDMEALYRDYTDMEEQGHFSPDSPDLARMTAIIDMVEAGARVLDMGCNSGAIGHRLIEDKQCLVAGVDLSPALVRRSRDKGIDAHVAFAEETPFGDRTFDVVICGELLEHVLDPGAVLREAARVLNAQGIVVGSVPHADGQWGEADLGHHPEHLRAYDEEVLLMEFAEAGFTLERTVVHEYGLGVPQEIVFSARRRND